MDDVAVDAKRILLRYGAPINVLDDVSDVERIELARFIAKTALPDRERQLRQVLADRGYMEPPPVKMRRSRSKAAPSATPGEHPPLPPPIPPKPVRPSFGRPEAAAKPPKSPKPPKPAGKAKAAAQAKSPAKAKVAAKKPAKTAAKKKPAATTTKAKRKK